MAQMLLMENTIVQVPTEKTLKWSGIATPIGNRMVSKNETRGDFEERSTWKFNVTSYEKK
jgi:hypothetical protein